MGRGAARPGLGLGGRGVPACGNLVHDLAQPVPSRLNRDTVFADRCPRRFGYRDSTWFLPVVGVGRWYGALHRRDAGLPR